MFPGLGTAADYLGKAIEKASGGRITVKVYAAGELVLGPIREAMRAHVTLAPAEHVSVVPAELGNWAGAIGAALAGRNQLEVRAR